MTTMTMKTDDGVRIEIDELLARYLRNDDCDEHGPFENIACAPISYFAAGNEPRWIGCPECQKKRDINQKRWEREKQELKLLADRIARCGIPYRFRDATLATYVATDSGQRRALEVAESYADDFENVHEHGQSLLLLGNIGTGKTHIAIAIAREAMEQGYEAIFVSTAEMLGKVKATWGNGGDSESKVIRHFADVDLLVLDEVGSIKCSGREREILFAILGQRHNAALPTIFTANLTADELPGYLGDQIVSRLRESGTRSVIFNWRDYRPIKGKAMMNSITTAMGRSDSIGAKPIVGEDELVMEAQS